MRFATVQSLVLGDATQATVTSNAIDTCQWIAYSAHAIAAGATITGTVKVQVSNDEILAGQPVNWVDLTSASVSVTGAGSFLIPKADVCYRWMRIVYTKTTSAVGALISVNVNGIGF